MTIRLHEGRSLPINPIRLEPPDTQRAHGYYRLMELVEQNYPKWVEFDFQVRKLAQRVQWRLKHHHLGHRYEVIWAGTLVDIRRKDSAEAIFPEAGRAGSVLEDEGAVPDNSDRKTDLP